MAQLATTARHRLRPARALRVDHRRSRGRHARSAARLRRSAGCDRDGLELPYRDARGDPQGACATSARSRSKNAARRCRSPLSHVAHRPRPACCASSTSATASTRSEMLATCRAAARVKSSAAATGCPQAAARIAGVDLDEAAGRVPRHRGVAGRRRRRRASTELGRVQRARRRPGQAAAQDRRLPPDPARHDVAALQRRLGACSCPTSARSRQRCASSTSSATTSTACSSSRRTRSSCWPRAQPTTRRSSLW